MKIAALIQDEALRSSIDEVAASMGAEVVDSADALGSDESRDTDLPDVVIAQIHADTDVGYLRSVSRRTQSALLLVCKEGENCPNLALADADDWMLLPVSVDELKSRIIIAQRRSRQAMMTRQYARSAELVRYRELLYDKLTGFPTLPIMVERGRDRLEQRGELTVLYIHFVWYEKIEEFYGWQKLDDILETTAQALRDFYAMEGNAENIMMVSHIGDDDLILFVEFPSSPYAAQEQLRSVSERLEANLRAAIESVHGEDIASLCGIHVGATTVFRNPKVRTERLIYRGIREAANAAHGAEQWERARKVTDLKNTIRDGAVFIEYHPIIITESEAVYGYEALARGVLRELRSPEVLFAVAEEANLVWELSRLLRGRAVSGIIDELKEGQYLFLNIDPHDFDDPAFRNFPPEELGITDPSRVVLEITERVAIKDYPRFQEHLKGFRERGFRFAVDDAGSGYAGLGSIANLEPDYIKLDISLIANIDTNFLKQNLVETMVSFANSQGTQVIAEGVERQEEFDTIKQLGVHYVQGFLFHRPRYAGHPDTPIDTHVEHHPETRTNGRRADRDVDVASGL